MATFMQTLYVCLLLLLLSLLFVNKCIYILNTYKQKLFTHSENQKIVCSKKPSAGFVPVNWIQTKRCLWHQYDHHIVNAKRDTQSERLRLFNRFDSFINLRCVAVFDFCFPFTFISNIDDYSYISLALLSTLFPFQILWIKHTEIDLNTKFTDFIQLIFFGFEIQNRSEMLISNLLLIWLWTRCRFE